jgi:hypothetical protein
VLALESVADNLTSLIQTKRTIRLRQREVSADKLDRIRSKIEQSLLGTPQDFAYFRKVAVRSAALEHDGDPIVLRFGGFTKAELLDPPMETESANRAEALAKEIKTVSTQHVWTSFYNRSHESIIMQSPLEDEEFWSLISAPISSLVRPVLVVPRQIGERSIRRSLRLAQTGGSGLDIQRKTAREAGASYIATVHDVDIYESELPSGSALLFSERELRAVVYGQIDDVHCVRVAFEPHPENELTGCLRVEFRQLAEWSDSRSFMLRSAQFEVQSSDR